METNDGQIEHKTDKSLWSNEDKIELVKLRLQGLTFKEIGIVMGRSRHSVRSEYGRIRRGETDVALSLAEFTELRKLLPLRKSFIQDEEEKEKNVLKLEKIYSRDEVEYAEINLNDYTYRVKETDIFSYIYLVQAINNDSVALLKGDEIINISIDEIIYD